MTVMGSFRHLMPKWGGSADRLEMYDQMMSFWHLLFPLPTCNLNIKFSIYQCIKLQNYIKKMKLYQKNWKIHHLNILEYQISIYQCIKLQNYIKLMKLYQKT